MKPPVHILKIVGVIGLFLASCGPGSEQANDYCAYGDRSVVLLIDVTTEYDEFDKERLVDGVLSIADRLEIGDRLSIWTITDDFTKGNRSFEGCLPGCPEQDLGTWVMGGCRSVIALRDLQGFKRGFAQSVRPLVTSSRSFRQSEIIRSLWVTLQKMGDATDVIVFSDMLENSNSMLPFAQLRSMPNDRLVRKVIDFEVLPNLAGKRLRIFGFGRLHNAARSGLTPAEHKKIKAFWLELFAAAGAVDVQMSLNYSDASETTDNLSKPL